MHILHSTKTRVSVMLCQAQVEYFEHLAAEWGLSSKEEAAVKLLHEAVGLPYRQGTEDLT